MTANLGKFDDPVKYTKQELRDDIELEIFKFDDSNFPPRVRTMSPRMQYGIPKRFGWQLKPNFDYYIWVDASCTIDKPNIVNWFTEQCEGYDMALFKHPERNTIKEEADFIRYKMSKGNAYLITRYENEFLDEQMQAIFSDPDFTDNALYASTSFVYNNTFDVQWMMKEWWYHCTRYHALDQLSLPYLVQKFKLSVNVINEDVYHSPHITFIRKSRRYKI